MDWDVFISHAWKDKETFARPLAKALEAKGLRVWFDEFSLTVGDSLRRSIDEGWSGPNPDFPIVSDITIQPGEEYIYNRTRIFYEPGYYIAEPAIRSPNGEWGGIQSFTRVEFTVTN